MSKLMRILGSILLFAILSVPTLGTAKSIPFNYPFSLGEKLTYKIKWGIFPAGKMVFEVKSIVTLNKTPCYHFVMTAETNSFVDKFFKVRDQYDGFAALDMSHSLFFKKKQKEGKLHTDIEVQFDWKNQTTYYSNFQQDFITVPLFPNSFDPLSFFYRLRLEDFNEKGTYNIAVADGKECFNGMIHFIKKKKVKTQAGKFSAILLEPDMDSYGWIFRQTKNTRLKIWFSRGPHKIPVKFSTRVTFGSFTCELESFKRPPSQSYEFKPKITLKSRPQIMK